MSTDDDEVEAIGWNAIDGALAPIYGQREPKHYGTIIPMMLGGKDPLQGISVNKNLSPAPHYHFVTYGFSELYEKESNDPEHSGYGFELTFRLACGANADEEPPTWPLSLLQNIARYVFSTGNALDARHHMTLNGPIAIDEATEITAIFLILDPQLAEIDTRNGHVKFLQIVGLCDDEYGLVQQGYFSQIADRVTLLAPLSITEIFRPSILRDQKTLDEIISSEPTVTQAEVFGTVVEWSGQASRLEIRIGATIIPQLKSMLKGRLAKGEPIAVYGKRSSVVFEPGDNNAWKIEESLLIVTMTAEVARYFGDHLQVNRGDYACNDFGPLKLSVVPIDIKDADDKVIKTVG